MPRGEVVVGLLSQVPSDRTIGEKAMASNCVRGGLDWILGKISLLKG